MYISVGITNPEMLMEKIQPKKHDSCFAPHVQTIKQASTARRQTAWMKALYQKKKTQSYSSAGFTMGPEYFCIYNRFLRILVVRFSLLHISKDSQNMQFSLQEFLRPWYDPVRKGRQSPEQWIESAGRANTVVEHIELKWSLSSNLLN